MQPILVAAVLAAAPLHAVPANCSQTFSKPMITRAIDAAYHGTRNVSQSDRAHLRRFIHCARRYVSRARMKRYRHDAITAWKLRRADAAMQLAFVSYYTDHGGGACGVDDVQNGYRFASLFLPCGAMVRMCHGSSCVDAQMADHGPYVSGRLFDLNDNLRAALGCGGLCYVRWRRL